MKNSKKFIVATLFLLMVQVQQVFAEVKFNTAEADRIKNNTFTPAAAWFMGIVGVAAALACAIQYVRWVLKDEEEREQKSYFKTIKPILIGLAIIESFSSLLLILSISV